jgi:hypothetical protein
MKHYPFPIFTLYDKKKGWVLAQSAYDERFLMCDLTRGKAPERQIATIWRNGSAQTVDAYPFFQIVAISAASVPFHESGYMYCRLCKNNR